MSSHLSVRRRLRSARRAALARRRLLASVLVGLSVLIGLRAAQGPAPATVPVPVASSDLATGDRIGADDVVLREWPAALAPAGLSGPVAGRVLAAPLRAGEPITDVRLVGSDLAQAHPELTVVPLRLPDPAVVDLLEVGDRIDVSAVDPETGTSREVASDVLVLAIPAASSAGSNLTGRLVVAGISPDRAAGVTGATLTEFLTVAYAR